MSVFLILSSQKFETKISPKFVSRYGCMKYVYHACMSSVCACIYIYIYIYAIHTTDM